MSMRPVVEDTIRTLASVAHESCEGLACNQNHVILSEALEEAGFENLAKSVLCGIIWAGQIAAGEDLNVIEAYASLDSEDESWQPYRDSWFRPGFDLSAKRQELASRAGQ